MEKESALWMGVKWGGGGAGVRCCVRVVVGGGGGTGEVASVFDQPAVASYSYTHQQGNTANNNKNFWGSEEDSSRGD